MKTRSAIIVCVGLVSMLLILTISAAQEKEKPAPKTGATTCKVPVAVCTKCGHWEVGNAPLKCPKCKATRDNFKDEEKVIAVGPELAPNCGFEKGARSAPEGWDEVDGLSSYYIKRPGAKGRCLKFDSDVYPADVDARAEQMKLPADKRPKAKPKKPTSGKKYDTIAGTRGALLWSDYIEVEPGVNYLLRAEVNTYAPEVKVFIKGYALKDGERRIGYKKYLVCLPEDKNELGSWKLYICDFTPENPLNKRLKFKWVKVMIMVFWPPGEAYVDNISIRKIIGAAEKEEGKKSPPEKKEGGEKPKRKEK